MSRSTYFIVALLCVLHSSKILTQPVDLKNIPAEAKLFARAEHALKKHDTQNYQRLVAQLQSYPLYPYLIYQELKQSIEEQKPTSITLQQLEDFQNAYPDFPFHTQLRNLWLKHLAQDQNWSAFVKGYKPSNKIILECQYHFGKYQLTHNKAALAPVKKLWLVGHSQPPECDPVLTLWKENGNFTQPLIWDRFKLALENKNFSLTNHLIKQMSPKEKDVASLWESLVKDPALLNNPDILKKLHEQIKQLKSKLSIPDILVTVLPIYASIHPENAATWWKAHQKEYAFSKTQSHQIYRDIAIQLARQKNSIAEEWLANLPPGATNLMTQEWRIRTNLNQLNWANVLKQIHELPPHVKQEKCWRYWEARALEKLNHSPEAEMIYKQLAQTRSYYGFLSAMRLKVELALQHRAIPFDPQATKKVLSLPAIKRFEQLLLLGKDHLARYEWFRATDNMNDSELNASAKIAQKMNLPDYAIITALKGSHRDDVFLRFPLVHHSNILSYASQHQLDPAWVFAIARQESSFFSGTVSAAGARGLMQLMPKTAAMLSKRYHIPYPSEDALHDPLFSIQLGTVYLRDLKQKWYDNPILATASYNAGPQRIHQWLPDKSTDPDIWIENIPYKETREYVKNVFMFTGIYGQQLGLPSTLELMMKPIPAKEKPKNTPLALIGRYLKLPTTA